jgi:hypothetical protein
VARIALVFVLAGIALAATTMGGSAQEGGSIVLSGNDLRHPLRLSRTDEDDFRRRLTLPPILEVAPELRPDSYMVTTTYWDEVVRDGRQDEPPVDAMAHYFEDEGFVRARQGGKDVWLVLDLRQREILHRYLRLGRRDRLPERPGALQVLSQAWTSEEISIEVEGDQLSPLERNIFFTGIARGEAPSFPDQPIEITARRGVWIVFGLPEGRSVRILYDPGTQEFIDAYGTEVYRVPEQTALAVAAANSPGRGPQIEAEEGRGSLIWWAIMLGAGAGALGVAALVRRRGESAGEGPPITS